jgi:chaperonin cofactor prefoldin
MLDGRVFNAQNRSFQSQVGAILTRDWARFRLTKTLNNKNESLDVSLCIYQENHWEIEKEITKLNWPKTGVLYPEK